MNGPGSEVRPRIVVGVDGFGRFTERAALGCPAS